jgi:hypothetical protein
MLVQLKTIINEIEQGALTEAPIDFNRLCQELGLEYQSYTWTQIDDKRLKCYTLYRYGATNDQADIRVWFLDDRTLAVTRIKGPNRSILFQWLSREAFETVKDYVKKFLVIYPNKEITLLDPYEPIELGLCKIGNYHLLSRVQKANCFHDGKWLELLEPLAGSPYHVVVKSGAIEFKTVDIRECLFPCNLNINWKNEI